MVDSLYLVEKTSNGLTVAGPLADRNDGKPWRAVEVGADRLLLEHEDSKRPMLKNNEGLGNVPIEAFADIILGLHCGAWSGVVSVDTGKGVKKLFFSEGEIVFAASNLIDDRLGEIIYRQEMLTLDQLTMCSAQVTRSKKFGQVLLQSRIFNNLQLWDALRAQVQEIVRSIFAFDSVYFELAKGRGLAPTELSFATGTKNVLVESIGYGHMFRAFAGRLSPTTVIEIMDYDKVRSVYGAETFIGDFVLMIRSAKSFGELLSVSKLTKINTAAVLMSLVHLGVCAIDSAAEEVAQRDWAHLAKLKLRIDIYAIILADVQKSFAAAQLPFPAADIRRLVRVVDSDLMSSLLLNRNGEITRLSVECMVSQCRSGSDRSGYFISLIDSLIRFVLQVAGDNLPSDAAKRARDHYRNLSL